MTLLLLIILLTIGAASEKFPRLSTFFFCLWLSFATATAITIGANVGLYQIFELDLPATIVQLTLWGILLAGLLAADRWLVSEQPRAQQERRGRPGKR